MTGTEIIAFFHNLIDDTIDGDFALQLLNNAKEEIESERDWEILKKEDSSNTFSASESYADAKSLPSDCDRIRKVNLGDDNNEYVGVALQDKYKYKEVSGMYFVDWANSNMHICGTVAGTKTIHLFYVMSTSDIETGTEPAWPGKYKKIVSKLIGFKMAELYLAGLEADDITAKMTPEHIKRADILMQILISWDARLKLQAMAHQTPLSNDIPATEGRINMDE